MTNPRNATTTSRGRTYKWADEQFDSVTTIIGRGVPKPALKAWGEKLVATTAVAKKAIWADMTDDEAIDWLKRSPFRETDKAATQGSDIHAWAEAYVLGQPMPELPLLQQPYGEAFKQFLADFTPRYEMTEATVYSRRHNYAGTLDALMWLQDPTTLEWLLWLVDLKTGKGVYGEVALQLAAYRYADFIGMPDGTEVPMPEVHGCAVLHVTAKGYELIPVVAGEAEHRSFLYVQQVGSFLARKDILGAPLEVQRAAS